MSGLEGKTIETSTGRKCKVEKSLGSGTQGEVYRARIENETFALKWYLENQATQEQRKRLEELVKRGAPSDKFLWPLEIIDDPGGKTFGYLMGLREPRFKGIVDMMKRRAEPTFTALCTAGYEMANSYLLLHSKGLSYCDISFGNIFFDPHTGEVRICDNDNVTVSGASDVGVLGTPRFMAPEIVRGEATPSTDTDLFSLSVLLFYMFMIHHPLEGRKEYDIHCMDKPAMDKLYGFEPVFIYDPADPSNRPVKGVHDNAITYWPIYPQHIRDLFTRSFTDGLRDPQNGRVRESEWRKAFVQARDSIIYCRCGRENFYDSQKLQSGQPHTCWRCGPKSAIQLPPRMRIEPGMIVMLNYNTKLYPHHFGETHHFEKPIGEVTQHPQDPNIWGIKNLTTDIWSYAGPDGTTGEVEAGRSVTINVGVKLHINGKEGEITV